MPPEHSRQETPAEFAARLFGPLDNPHTIIEVDLNGNPIQPDHNLSPELYSEVDPASIPSSPEPTLDQPRSRFWQFGRYSGRTALAGVLLVASGAALLHEEPISTETTQTVAETTVPHAVYRTGGDGVWLHDSPGLNTPLKVVMPEGAPFNVDCFVTGGDNVNGNRLWLQGDYNGTPGAVTDYYIDTKWNTTQDLVNQGIEECGTQAATAPAPEPEQAPQSEQPPTPQERTPEQKSCYFNMKWLKTDLTFSYEGDQRYYGNAWQAAKNWTDLDAGISIKPAPEGQAGDIVFRDGYFKQGVYAYTEIDRELEENPVTTVPTHPRELQEITITANQYFIEEAQAEKYRLNDRGITYTLTHELGHALGLAHPNGNKFEKKGCGIDMYTTGSVMKAGNDYDLINDKRYTTPQEYDKIALRALYNR